MRTRTHTRPPRDAYPPPRRLHYTPTTLLLLLQDGTGVVVELADHPLVGNLKRLRQRVQDVVPHGSVSPPPPSPPSFPALNGLDIVRPFADVVRSEDTSGPITLAALSALQQIVALPGATQLLRGADAGASVDEIADAVTQCRFEASDTQSDEVVLMQILRVLASCVACPAGRLASADTIWSAFEAIYMISCEGRHSKLLRKLACDALVEVTRAVFAAPAREGRSKRAEGAGGVDIGGRLKGVEECDGVGMAETAASASASDAAAGVSAAAAAGAAAGAAAAAAAANAITSAATGGVAATVTATADGDNVENSAEAPVSEDAADDVATTAAATAATAAVGAVTGAAAAATDTDPAASTTSGESEETLPLDGIPTSSPSSGETKQDGSACECEVGEYDSDLGGSTSAVRIISFLVQQIDPDPAVGGTSGGAAAAARKASPAGRGAGVLPAGARLLCFRLINTILECSTGVLGTDMLLVPPVWAVVKDDLCRALLLTTHEADARLLSIAMRTVYLLVLNFRGALHMQVETFINGIYLSTLEGLSGGLPENKVQVVLESLCDILAIPSILPDLYVVYDCELECSDVVQNLYKYLSKSAFPAMEENHQQTPSYVQRLSLRCVYFGIRFIALRSDDEASTNAPADDRLLGSGGSEGCSAGASDTKDDGAESGVGGTADGDNDTPGDNTTRSRTGRAASGGRQGRRLAAECLEQIERKRVLQRGVQLFNQKPKKGIAHLGEAGILATPSDTPFDPQSVALFLRRTPGLDKQIVGQYLGTGSEPHHDKLRTEYVALFDLSGQSLLASLRQFLEAFRLPGEAQQIDRVLDAFAGYALQHSVDAKHLASRDCAFLLSFAIIMLNTDLHNPNIKAERKMTMEQFIKHNSNYGEETNHGRAIPAAFLRDIFIQIQHKQINVKSAVATLTSPISSDRWRDLIRQADTTTSGGQRGNDAKDGAGVVSGVVRSMPGHRGGSIHAADGHDPNIFAVLWGPMIAAFSVVFDTDVPQPAVQSVDRSSLKSDVSLTV